MFFVVIKHYIIFGNHFPFYLSPINCITTTMKLKAEQSKKRITELDKLIERIYTDNVMGKISDERFAIMSANFEAEQKELREALSNLEQSIIDAETEKVDMKRFLETIRECTDLKELTPAIVNTLIKRIVWNS